MFLGPSFSSLGIVFVPFDVVASPVLTGLGVAEGKTALLGANLTIGEDNGVLTTLGERKHWFQIGKERQREVRFTLFMRMITTIFKMRWTTHQNGTRLHRGLLTTSGS